MDKIDKEFLHESHIDPDAVRKLNRDVIRLRKRLDISTLLELHGELINHVVQSCANISSEDIDEVLAAAYCELRAKHGYCELCARKAVEYVLDIPAAGCLRME